MSPRATGAAAHDGGGNGTAGGRGRRKPAAAPPALAPVPDAAPDAVPDCDPRACPCDDGICTLSRYVRSTQAAEATARPSVRGQHTLDETERLVAERLGGMSIDMDAMAAVSNVYRAAGTVRNHFERTVLQPHDLTWTAWVVLWVVWIWGDIETRHVAAEAGISKGTLTGVATTLENRGLLVRSPHPDDGRRVLVSLTPAGGALMERLFPQFNAEEAFVTADLTPDEVHALAVILRKVVRHVESAGQAAPDRAGRAPGGAAAARRG